MSLPIVVSNDLSEEVHLVKVENGAATATGATEREQRISGGNGNPCFPD